MPCRNEMSDYEGTSRTTKVAEARSIELDRVTKFLCIVLTEVFKSGNEKLRLAISSKKELSAWWSDHQAFDRKRNEAAKQRVPELLKIFQDLSEEDQQELLQKLKDEQTH